MTGPVPESEIVRVEFDSARAVEVAGAVEHGGQPFTVSGVIAVDGRLLGRRGDTLDLRLTGMRDRDAWLPARGYRGGTAAVVPGTRPVRVREFSAGRTSLAVLGTVAGVGLAAVTYVVIRLGELED
jgi:hypothetical protein